MSDMRLIVNGAAGRMGRILIKTISETPGVTVIGALERSGSPALGQDAGTVAGLAEPLGVAITDDPLSLMLDAEGVIDFAAPKASVEMSALAAQAPTPQELAHDTVAGSYLSARHAGVERDPAFVFVQSQPQLCAFVAERDPAFFARLRSLARAWRRRYSPSISRSR